ncbi:UbiA-like polyprenyltransferase [Thermoanaerobacterium thermosaccharolyticum]|uniref:4-hydroxybenzoate polyprenyltransferase n=2 Tax=Thermoanaerobacterium thermosaccharolyticum TaxID=1517 RepID=L0IKD1_THETR|nr:UbiA-like polyprenyltransferase [Thermoanaerobacterium thermosaccharolyticum]AGB19283.1 4-hydroxybenzoate octaprenyltransferase [Thermoanaerobacterium thermosaccharolyticum M0795]
MVFKKIKQYADLVMFSHTLFSMPFAMVSMLWAANGLPKMRVFFWIIIALIGARTGANALNRLVDKDIDAKNPRTAGRHLPLGLVKSSEVLLIVVFSFALLVLAAYELNPLCLKLSPLALFLFIIYSYTKRFTWACHIILGIACGGAPVGAWIAVTGKIGWPSLVLGAVVTLWVAGFDIIYGTQDYDFDKNNGLFSIPVKFGIKNALLISTFFHVIALLLLLYLYFYMKMGWLYLMGLIIIGYLLYKEHSIVKPDNLKHVTIASYDINQIVSVLFFIFTTADSFLVR